jgi:hypothetical protein
MRSRSSLTPRLCDILSESGRSSGHIWDQLESSRRVRSRSQPARQGLQAPVGRTVLHKQLWVPCDLFVFKG